MSLIESSSKAPPVPGVDFDSGPALLFFYRVDCPVCAMAAPAVARVAGAYGNRVVNIGQDREPELESFGALHAWASPSVADPPPHALSRSYGIEVVPTTVLVGAAGLVAGTVEGWDRERLNELSRALGLLLGVSPVPFSQEGDGLPPFRPG